MLLESKVEKWKTGVMYAHARLCSLKVKIPWL
jgi:hypothetical protein